MLRNKLIGAEWRKDNKLFALHTLAPSDRYVKSYDVDWSEHYQGYYYHWSGGGPFRETDQYTLDGIPEHVKTMADAVVHFELDEAEGCYCKICDDWRPTDGLCEHVWWDDETADYAGPGYD